MSMLHRRIHERKIELALLEKAGSMPAFLMEEKDAIRLSLYHILCTFFSNIYYLWKF